MFKKLFITAIFVTTWMQASAQTLEKEYKASSEGNPISPCVFCADSIQSLNLRWALE